MIEPGAAAVERIELDASSWVEVGRGWLAGADELFEALLDGVAWRASRLFRYDHLTGLRPSPTRRCGGAPRSAVGVGCRARCAADGWYS
ncbi:MAG: hypothetical protein ACRD1K_09920 [Acidimicrobiales bacterium]